MSEQILEIATSSIRMGEICVDMPNVEESYEVRELRHLRQLILNQEAEITALLIRVASLERPWWRKLADWARGWLR